MSSDPNEPEDHGEMPNNAITDGSIRENQWKNCVGCIVFAMVVILGVLMILFGLARGCSA